MADVEMLEKVKKALGITGEYMDDTIGIYIDTVTDYMKCAGVSQSLISASAGVIARGVNDVWTNAGGGKLSPVFYDMVTQLALKSKAGG